MVVDNVCDILGYQTDLKINRIILLAKVSSSLSGEIYDGNCFLNYWLSVMTAYF